MTSGRLAARLPCSSDAEYPASSKQVLGRWLSRLCLCSDLLLGCPHREHEGITVSLLKEAARDLTDVDPVLCRSSCQHELQTSSNTIAQRAAAGSSHQLLLSLFVGTFYIQRAHNRRAHTRTSSYCSEAHPKGGSSQALRQVIAGESSHRMHSGVSYRAAQH